MSDLLDQPTSGKDKTVAEILYSWLRHIQNQGRFEVANYMMDEVVAYGKERFGQEHQASTYEREWRKAKQNYHWRFYEKRTDENGVKVWGIIKQ